MLVCHKTQKIVLFFIFRRILNTSLLSTSNSLIVDARCQRSRQWRQLSASEIFFTGHQAWSVSETLYFKFRSTRWTTPSHPSPTKLGVWMGVRYSSQYTKTHAQSNTHQSHLTRPGISDCFYVISHMQPTFILNGTLKLHFLSVLGSLTIDWIPEIS